MKYNQLGSSKMHVSEIGFGCMSLSENHESNEKLLHEAVDLGINYFDTADLYKFGFNEESVGRALAKKRHSVFLATKGGNEWGPDIDGWRWNPSKSYIKEACKNSLRRLGTDYIDLYQLHGGTIEDPLHESLEALDELVNEGLIRYYGTSSIRPNVIKRFVKNEPIVSNMMQYNILDRRPEEWFDLLNDHQVSVIARGPVAKGLLTSASAEKLTEDGYLDYSGEELKNTVQELQTIADEAGLSLSSLALRYVLSSKPVATAIQGARTHKQLRDNVSAANTSLSPDTLAAVQKAAKISYYDKHRD
ncbi:aldo/keto reductase [Alkalicoccus halolimnae]|uniref:Aldo/keto reductase n=1 Tax=Alkalicoccus halolimnae TaxID=1667239 RepID=A0A5C7FDD2_9BACI|nr:aldo/keto reductase [Alkalicoccus halolimnae]TXF83062.1 aldo/keto reductase [Alkalicoccus halolimnae]